MQKYFTNADAEGFNFAVALAEVYTTAGDGYWSDVSKAVEVTELGMYVATDADAGDGDFYVLYNTATWDDDVDGLIYTDSAFLANVQDKVRDVLAELGVDYVTANTIAGDVSYSEQGMQDVGRVSLDAYALADFLRNYYAVEVA